jgi:hypothetical protein
LYTGATFAWFQSSEICPGESQIISLGHQLAQNNDKNIQTDLIIKDFAKALDKVSHKRLISKLKFYGISDQIVCVLFARKDVIQFVIWSDIP